MTFSSPPSLPLSRPWAGVSAWQLFRPPLSAWGSLNSNLKRLTIRIWKDQKIAWIKIRTMLIFLKQSDKIPRRKARNCFFFLFPLFGHAKSGWETWQIKGFPRDFVVGMTRIYEFYFFCFLAPNTPSFRTSSLLRAPSGLSGRGECHPGRGNFLYMREFPDSSESGNSLMYKKGLSGNGFTVSPKPWRLGVRVSRHFGARWRSSVRYGTRLGDLKESCFVLFFN